MNISDLQQQFDDIETRFEDNDNALQEFSDNVDNSFNDVNDALLTQSDNLDTLNEGAGQLSFPLSQDSIDLITEQTPAMLSYMYNSNYIGTVVLVAGTVIVTNNYTSATSLIILSRSILGGTPGHLSYTTTAGSFTITSSSATDTSTIIYFILK